MSSNNDNVFNTLFKIDVEKQIKKKGKLSYLPWAAAWAEVKKIYPDADFKIYPQIMDEYGNTRPWHDDGKTGWVEVGVTIEGKEIVETLAIMDFKNQSIPAEDITSTDANKSIKRCLVKACALQGLATYIFMGEDLPEELALVDDLKDKITALVKKKVALSDKAKEKVATLCKDAQKKAFPELEDDLISGDYKNISDSEILEELHKKLLAVRK